MTKYILIVSASIGVMFIYVLIIGLISLFFTDLKTDDTSSDYDYAITANIFQAIIVFWIICEKITELMK